MCAPPLQCTLCRKTYTENSTAPWQCDCGGLFDFDWTPLDPAWPPQATNIPNDGLWVFDEWLPMEPNATLGEGWTPIVDSPIQPVQYKLEYLFPSGSYKDRGATTLVSHALALGVDRIAEDSSGNAGAAIAQYAGHAGIETDIYLPASVKDAKINAIKNAGATPVIIDGERKAVTDACIDAVETQGHWYGSHVWNPAFFSGMKTFAYEIVFQLGGRAPAAVVLPVGNGTLFLGAYRGFKELAAEGIIDSVPKLVAVQAAGATPIADQFGSTPTGNATMADGIMIPAPPRKQQIIKAITHTDGYAVAVNEREISAMMERLHRNGLYIEPTSAVAPAGYERIADNPQLQLSTDTVVPLTGSGLKTM